MMKRSLSVIMAIQVEGVFATIGQLAHRLSLSASESRDIVSELVRGGLVTRRGSRIHLTDGGRHSIKVVMTGGVFDLIHTGHIATLEGAKRLGDMLVVVVARDISVQRTKGRSPLNDEAARLRVVQSLKPVDAARLGDKRDMYVVVQSIGPDIIAIGYDQKHEVRRIVRELKRRGLRAQVMRLRVRVPGAKTSNILSQIGSESYPHTPKGFNR
jgi:cytidyltransferase-like protein